MSAPLVRRLDVFPDLLDMHCARPARYPHLLESVTPGGSQARYDILFAFPGERLALSAASQPSGSDQVDAPDFLNALDDRCACYAETGEVPENLPFFSGWFVYLGYELVGQIEPGLKLPATKSRLPTALAQRFPAAVIRDHMRRCVWLVAAVGEGDILHTLETDLECLAPQRRVPATVLNGVLEEDDPDDYLKAVARIREYILAGDVFQVNLSRRWRGRLCEGIKADAVYRRLRQHNPAPFAGLATWDDLAIISSSPERLVHVGSDGCIETRPIAGTRPRGQNALSDQANSAELMVHPKERAEHVMLIDLARNDLGRVCETASINVNEIMVLESYSHVHHIVSNIRGRLRPAVSPGQVIRAVFPGGTITGCPKVRCIQILAELEREGRGAYTGALGYIDDRGGMDFNILIRTLVVEGEELQFRAGAGIVADSIPRRELEETRAKARGLVLALTNTAG